MSRRPEDEPIEVDLPDGGVVIVAFADAETRLGDGGIGIEAKPAWPTRRIPMPTPASSPRTATSNALVFAAARPLVVRGGRCAAPIRMSLGRSSWMAIGQWSTAGDRTRPARTAERVAPICQVAEALRGPGGQ